MYLYNNYTFKGGSDESGWTKDISHDYTGDWPSLPPDASISSSVSILNSVPSSLINSTFAEVTTATTSQSSGDDLISLLEKLGLEKYQEHFQVHLLLTVDDILLIIEK